MRVRIRQNVLIKQIVKEIAAKARRFEVPPVFRQPQTRDNVLDDLKR